MMMSYEDARDFTRRESGDDSPQPLVFIPGENFDPSDEDDVEAVREAMDRDMADRAAYWREKYEDAQREIARLQGDID